MESNDNNGGLMTRLTGWMKQPFSGQMDALHWFLFLGLVLVAVFMWSRIMYYINKGVESV